MPDKIIKFSSILEILKKHLMMIVSLTLVAAVLGASYSFFLVTPNYEAQTQVIAKISDSSAQALAGQVQANTQMATTVAQVMVSPTILEDVKNELQLSKSVNEIKSEITATAGLITTTLWGMLANIALSFALVPVIGLNGAGVSGSLGFLLVTILRYRQTQKFVPVKVNWSLLSAFIALYGLVSILTLTDQPVFYGGAIVLAMFALLVKALPHTAKVALKGKLKIKTN